MSPIRIAKWAIALTPAALSIYEEYKAGGPVNAANALSQTYTGYDFMNKNFNTGRLAIGYVPLIGAWVFGKVASRVLR